MVDRFLNHLIVYLMLVGQTLTIQYGFLNVQFLFYLMQINFYLIYFDSFVKNDPFVVKKERHTIYVTPFYYEIDFFLNLDLSIQNKELDISMLKGEKLCVLEIEFKSLLEYNHFKPDFEAINVTKTRGFSNRMMARKIGLDKN